MHDHTANTAAYMYLCAYIKAIVFHSLKTTFAYICICNQTHLEMSNSTHVANAYPNTIWVYFTSREVVIDRVIVRRDGELEIVFGREETAQMIRIPSGKHYRYDRHHEYDYLTVYTKNPARSGSEASMLCECLEMPTNRSFLIKPNGEVIQSYYETWYQGGKSDIWKDRYGNDYSKYSK